MGGECPGEIARVQVREARMGPVQGPVEARGPRRVEALAKACEGLGARGSGAVGDSATGAVPVAARAATGPRDRWDRRPPRAHRARTRTPRKSSPSSSARCATSSRRHQPPPRDARSGRRPRLPAEGLQSRREDGQALEQARGIHAPMMPAAARSAEQDRKRIARVGGRLRVRIAEPQLEAPALPGNSRPLGQTRQVHGHGARARARDLAQLSEGDAIEPDDRRAEAEDALAPPEPRHEGLGLGQEEEAPLTRRQARGLKVRSSSATTGEPVTAMLATPPIELTPPPQ